MLLLIMETKQETQMTIYLFRYQGETKAFCGSMTKHEAMGMANKHFPLGAGCWWDHPEGGWVWKEGNFFDKQNSS
jgi:hypothetical protein